MRRSIDDFYIPPPRTYHGRGAPPPWLLGILGVCLVLLIVFSSARSGNGAQGMEENIPPSKIPEISISPDFIASKPPVFSEVSAAPEPAVTSGADVVPQPETIPEPVVAPVAPDPAGGAPIPVPLGTYQAQDWFSDAIFIGDSRTDGFKMYSGVFEADYLDYTGLSIYDIANGKPVIRSNGGKISVLDALSQKNTEKFIFALA